jgi:hypothetical protein
MNANAPAAPLPRIPTADDADFCRRALAAKTPSEQVVYMLVGRGLVEPQARGLVTSTQLARTRTGTDTANLNLIIGGVLLVVGLFITIISYSSASNRGSGSYVIMYGPIIFGVLRIVRGLAGRARS